MQLTIVLVSFIAAASATIGNYEAQVPYIPCPNHFRYIRDSQNRIEGYIMLPYQQSPELDIRVNASMPGYFGKEHSNMKLALITPIRELLQGSAPYLHYKLTFPVQESIPTITSIVLNSVSYCSGPREHLSYNAASGQTAVTNMYCTHHTKFSSEMRSGLDSANVNNHTVVTEKAQPE